MGRGRGGACGRGGGGRRERRLPELARRRGGAAAEEAAACFAGVVGAWGPGTGGVCSAFR